MYLNQHQIVQHVLHRHSGLYAMLHITTIIKNNSNDISRLELRNELPEKLPGRGGVRVQQQGGVGGDDEPHPRQLREDHVSSHIQAWR